MPLRPCLRLAWALLPADMRCSSVRTNMGGRCTPRRGCRMGRSSAAVRLWGRVGAGVGRAGRRRRRREAGRHAATTTLSPRPSTATARPAWSEDPLGKAPWKTVEEVELATPRLSALAQHPTPPRGYLGVTRREFEETFYATHQDDKVLA